MNTAVFLHKKQNIEYVCIKDSATSVFFLQADQPESKKNQRINCPAMYFHKIANLFTPVSTEDSMFLDLLVDFASKNRFCRLCGGLYPNHKLDCTNTKNGFEFPKDMDNYRKKSGHWKNDRPRPQANHHHS